MEAELKAAGAEFTSSGIKCPFHEDKHPSGGTYQGDKDKVWRFKCQTVSCGFWGDVFDVRAKRTGKPLTEILKEAAPPMPWEAALARKQGPRIYGDLDQLVATLGDGLDSTYKYTNPDTGKIDLVVCKFVRPEGKTFKQIHMQGNGYILGSPPKPWPIYNRTRIKQADTVLLVEGEKCVHAAATIGVVATTSPCGAGKAEYADWTPLAGKKAILWPDNDTAGRNHMEDVARILSKLDPPTSVSVIDPAKYQLGPKQDIADYLEALDSDVQKVIIDEAITNAEPYGTKSGVSRLFKKIGSGEISDVSWPWDELTRLTNALLPGTITLLCGDPGSTKSFLLLESSVYWYRLGYKIAVFALEDDHDFHCRRILAQVAGNANLMNNAWVKSNQALADEAIRQYDSFLIDIGKHLYDMPAKQVDHAYVLDWINAQAKSGARIIGIDPVTAIEATKEPWVADQKFIASAKNIMKDYGASLVCVTHPKKGRKSGVDMEDMAGGAAYSRFSHCIMWIKAFKEPVSMTVRSSSGTWPMDVNRSIKLNKTRNSTGIGWDIGYMFDGRTLTFHEQGVILDEPKKAKY